MLAEWARDAIDFSGIAQAEVGRRLTEKLGRSIDRAAVNKMVAGTRAIAADEMLAIAEVTGYPAPGGAQSVKVPLYSLLAAAPWMMVETVMEGQAPLKWLTEQLPIGNWLAFEVTGDSMDRVAPDGSLIFVDRDERDLASGRLYAVCLDSGEATFKRYRSDPPRLEPMSSNPAHEAMFFSEPSQIQVIGRVRKVVNHLP